MNSMQQIKAYLVYIGDEVKAVEIPSVISTEHRTQRDGNEKISNKNKQLSLEL